jgi:hypothetical protein
MNDSLKFSLLEEAEALYEADIGPVDLTGSPAAPLRHARKAGGKTRIPEDMGTPFGTSGIPIKKDAAKKSPMKGRYDEEEPEEESYTSGFSLRVSGAYFDEKEKSMKVEYRLLPGRDVQKAVDVDTAAWHEMEPAPFQKNEDLMQGGATEQIARSGNLSIEKYAENILSSNLSATYEAGVLNIEYKDVELIGGQKTYQRIVLKAEKGGESVYGLTMRKLSEAGIDVSSEYEIDFESMILTSINGKAEGTDGNFNEFYLNGEIGANAVDKQKLSKGDIVEWRYAQETDGSCGGSPDFSAIKSLVEYSAVAKAQAQYFGILSAGPSPASYAGFGPGLIFH